MDEKVFEEAARDFLNGRVDRRRCTIDPLYAIGVAFSDPKKKPKVYKGNGEPFAETEQEAKWKIHLIDYAEKAFMGAWLEHDPTYISWGGPTLHIGDVAQYLCEKDGLDWWENDSDEYMEKARNIMKILFENGRIKIQSKQHIAIGSFGDVMMKYGRD